MHVNFEGELENLRRAERSTKRWARIWLIITIAVVILEALWAIGGFLDREWGTFLIAGFLAIMLAFWAPKAYRNDMAQARLFGTVADAIEEDRKFFDGLHSLDDVVRDLDIKED